MPDPVPVLLKHLPKNEDEYDSYSLHKAIFSQSLLPSIEPSLNPSQRMSKRVSHRQRLPTHPPSLDLLPSLLQLLVHLETVRLDLINKLSAILRRHKHLADIHRKSLESLTKLSRTAAQRTVYRNIIDSVCLLHIHHLWRTYDPARSAPLTSALIAYFPAFFARDPDTRAACAAALTERPWHHGIAPDELERNARVGAQAAEFMVHAAQYTADPVAYAAEHGFERDAEFDDVFPPPDLDKIAEAVQRFIGMVQPAHDELRSILGDQLPLHIVNHGLLCYTAPCPSCRLLRSNHLSAQFDMWMIPVNFHLQFRRFNVPSEVNVGYAVLSHVWRPSEQSFEEAFGLAQELTAVYDDREDSHMTSTTYIALALAHCAGRDGPGVYRVGGHRTLEDAAHAPRRQTFRLLRVNLALIDPPLSGIPRIIKRSAFHVRSMSFHLTNDYRVTDLIPSSSCIAASKVSAEPESTFGPLYVRQCLHALHLAASRFRSVTGRARGSCVDTTRGRDNGARYAPMVPSRYRTRLPSPPWHCERALGDSKCIVPLAYSHWPRDNTYLLRADVMLDGSMHPDGGRAGPEDDTDRALGYCCIGI
ncbi:hypothetical protein VTO73DRAFT_7185 [Trametes versicolor]